MAAVSSVTPSPLAPKVVLRLTHEVNGPSNLFAYSKKPGAGTTDFRTQVALALTERPETVADVVEAPVVLQETSPEVETKETEDPESQAAVAVTSCEVPSE